MRHEMRRGGIAAISNKIRMNGDVVYHHYPVSRIPLYLVTKIFTTRMRKRATRDMEIDTTG